MTRFPVELRLGASERAARRVLVGLVRAYRFWLSPWLGPSCRFWPSCSHYAIEAIDVHGAAAGSYLATRRLLRCQPFCRGGHDPVPPRRDRTAATAPSRSQTTTAPIFPDRPDSR